MKRKSKESKSIEHKSWRTTPREIYHGVPIGWSRSEVVMAHTILRGTFKLDTEEATEPGAPSWLPDRYNWLQYRATLQSIADGIKAGDDACVELAVRYIELDYFGSYSGFLKARFARLLKSQTLSDSQISRLNKYFELLIESKQCFVEFYEYSKLRKKLAES